MAHKKDNKLKIEAMKEPKKSVIDPIEVPNVAFTERAKVKSLMKAPSKQADFKPDYLKEAQFAHQIHLKSEPEAKPTPADMLSKGLMFAGDVAQRLGKSAAKIEAVVADAAPKKKVGRPKKADGEKKPKKQGSKDKEDEKLAMEVKGTKDAVAAVASELAKHEAESEAEEMVKPVEKKKRAARFAKGSAEAIAHMAKIRAARKKKEDK